MMNTLSVMKRTVLVALAMCPYATAQCLVEELGPETAFPGLEFGSAVAIANDRAIIGLGLGKGSQGPGMAAFYERNGSLWIKEAEVWASDGDVQTGGVGPGNQFGISVALDEEVAIVGAPFHTHTAPIVGFSGAAYVFRRIDGVWVEEAKLEPSDLEESGYFGRSVAIKGDVAVVGKPHDVNFVGGVPDVGGVYVFRRLNGVWTEEAKLQATEELDTNTRIGYSLCFDGSRILAGAPSTQQGTGRAYLFEHDGNSWMESEVFEASEPTTQLFFALSVALEGSVVAVGSPNSTAGGVKKAGAVYLYREEGEDWIEEAKVASDNPNISKRFGEAVAISRDRLMVGAPREQVLVGPLFVDDAGAAYVFTRDARAWTLTGKLIAQTPDTGAYFGEAVALDKGNMLVGAPAKVQETTPSTHAYGYSESTLSADPSQVSLMLGGTWLGSADPSQVSLMLGGLQVLSLSADEGLAGDLYIVLGAFSSGCPGIPLDHGLLPLGFDEYFTLSLLYANSLFFMNTLNFVGPSGTALAVIAIPAGLDPLLAGLELSHAFAVIDLFSGVVSSTSNTTSLTLSP